MGDQAAEHRNFEKMTGEHIVKLRGLPYSAQVKDVMDFLSDCNIMRGIDGIKFTFSADGRPSGEAFVELCSGSDVERAVGHHEDSMGHRYIEVFRAQRSQMDWDTRKNEPESGGEGVVRLRGLPYGCTEDQIRIFLSGLMISAIIMQKSEDGRESGEAFVRLASMQDVDKALERDRNKIQHRYIEVFRSSQSEVRPFKGGRPTPYSRPGGRGGGFMGYGTVGGGGGDKFGSSGYERSYRGAGGRGRGIGGRGRGFGYGGGDEACYEEPDYFQQGPPQGARLPQGEDPNLISYPMMRPSNRGGFGGRGGGNMGGAGSVNNAPHKHCVRMRGLPYSATEKEILEFFSPLPVLKVNINFDQSGRSSGEAEVLFHSHENATAAMQRNKNHMGHRYIELFLNSSGEAEPHFGADLGLQGSWNGGPSGGQTNGPGGFSGGFQSHQQAPPAPHLQAPPAPHQQMGGAFQPRPQFQQQNPGNLGPSVRGYPSGGFRHGAESGNFRQPQNNQQWSGGSNY